MEGANVLMSKNGFSLKKALPLIAITWTISLVTTLAFVYFAPSIFPPLETQNIADAAVTASKIDEGAIVTVKLADGSVTSAKILDGSITTVDLMDGSITSIKVANGTITNAKLAEEAVTTNKIADGAIVTAKLADGAVTSAKIVNGAIIAEDLADGSVIAVKIKDGAVTTNKIADGAIVTAKLADGAVTSAKIVNGAIIAEDLADGSVIAVKIKDGAVTTNKIADGAVTTPKIADGVVTDVKLASDAIPYFATYNASLVSTQSTSFVDLPETALNITLNRKSNLMIMFSAEAWVDGAGDEIYVRALVNSTVANPNSGSLTLFTTAGESQHGSYAVNFYLEDVDAGAYTVRIQWSERLGASFAHMGDRTLHVIALPA
jgi:hypothetical protein